jgi:large repetitive protein
MVAMTKGCGKCKSPIFNGTGGRIASLLLACVAGHTALVAPSTASLQHRQKRHFYNFRIPNRAFWLGLLCVLFSTLAFTEAHAQRAFAPRYTTNAKGDIAIAGNTVMRCNATAGTNFANCANTLAGIATPTIPTNNNFTMINVDVDSDVSTFNSSTSTLGMLPGSTVLFAGLYWGSDSSSAARNTVKFKAPGAINYTSITATQLDNIGNQYQAFANVTAIVAAAGNGIYTAADVQTTNNAVNVYGGWSLVVAYSNPASPTRNLSVYDGYQRVNSGTAGGGINISLSGFITPPFGAVNTTIGTVAYDGDRTSTEGTAGLQFGPTAATLSPVFNTANPQTDYFNSTISDFGVKRTTGQSPAFDNNFGFDLDLAKPNTPLPNNASTAVVRVSSSSETIDLGIVTLATDIFVPNIKDTLTKTVSKVAGAAGAAIIPGDTLEYVIAFYNAGQDGALKTVVTDSIPANTTYVPGSLIVVSTPTVGAPVLLNATDGSGDDVGEFDAANNRVVARVGLGATATVGGQVVPANASNLPSYGVKFRVTVNAATPGDTNIDNTARVDYTQQTLGAAISDLSDSNPAVPGDQPARVVVAGPDLVVAKSDGGASFIQGKTGSYTLTVSNNGLAPTFGVVTVTEVPPVGLTVTGLSGAGWTCTLATLKCTRSDVLATTNSYAPITVAVSVAADAPASVTNTATVACACEAASAAGNNSGTDSTPITPAPVLTATKTAGAAFVRGSTSSYTITLGAAASAGPINAVDAVVMTDTLPAGITLDGAPTGSGWLCTGLAGDTSFSCSRTGALAAGSTYAAITVPVRVALSAPASVDNTVSVSGGGATAPSSATVTTPVNASADVRIAKSVDNNAPTLGSPTVEFTLRVTNDGPSVATSVSVTDVLPAGLTFVSASPVQGSFAGSIWTVGSLNPGASTTLKIRATTTNFGPGITNTATVSAAEADPVPSNNTSSVTLQGQKANLSLTKSVDNAVPNVGGNVVYTLTVSNAGPDSATNVEVTDLLPATLTFVSASPAGYNAATGKWLVGTLTNSGAGSSATLQITAKPLVAGPIINRAEISKSDQFDVNSTPGNNVAGEDDQAQVTIIAQQADLSIAKSVNNPAPVIGETVVYVVTVSNAGPSTATGVVVNEDIPTGITLISATPSQGAFAAPVWTVGSIAAGGSAVLTIAARYDGPGRVTNTASITASNQPDPTVNVPATATVPSQIADLSLTKAVSSATPNVGSNVTFTVVVSNAGPDGATGVVVADKLPAGLSFVSAAPSQGSYDAATGDWAAGSIANGANATLLIVAKVTGLTAITNTAEVKQSRQFDPNSTPNNRVASENDQASATLTPQSADLRLAKSVTPNNPTIASPTVTYTIRLSNLGPSTATNVTISDALPAGVTFVPGTAAPSTGSFVPGTGVWTVPSLANGGNATLTFNATVSDFTKTLTNAAQITGSDQPDPTPEPAATATVLGQRADLSLAKTANTSTPLVGGNVSFTLTVSNAGPDAASGVVVRDLLPSGLTFVSAVPSRGGYDSATGLWSVGAVAVGAPQTLTLTALVSQITAAPIINRAEVSASDQFDPNSTPNNATGTENDEASATITPIPQADVTVAKAAPSALNPGANATFKLIVRNLGPSIAQAVQVADPTPAGLTLLTVSGGGCSALPCGLGALGPGDSRTVDVTYRVNFPATSASINNAATVSTTTADPSPANNTANTTTPVVTDADLKVVKTGPASVVPGENLDYSITVTNLGPSTAPAVSLADPVPVGLSFVAAGTPCASGFPCALGNIAVGASVTVSSRYLAPANLAPGAPISNVATVSSSVADPDSSNNAATVKTTIESPKSDLAISKVGPASVLKGETVSFTLSVNNAGPSDAANTVIADPTPAGLSLVSVTGDCTSLPCTFATLAVGVSKTVRVTYLVPLNYAGATNPAAIDNTATVKSDSGDVNPGNNSSTFTTQAITPPPILLLAKTSSAAFSRGSTGSYSIAVSVAATGGPTTGATVTVDDTLPAGLALVGVPSGGGWVCTVASPSQFSCTTAAVIAAGSAFPAITVNVAVGLAADDTVTNTATASGGGALTPASGSVTTPVSSSADLALSKGVDRNNPTLASPLVVFTLALENLGPSTASSVVVTDLLPAGVSFVSATPSLGTYTAATGLWSLGNVLPGTRASLQIRANVTDFASPITNVATVTSITPDPLPSNNTAKAVVQGQTANLSLLKLVDVSAPNVQGSVSFTLKVSNVGPDAATGVQVTDLLPSGLTFVSASPAGVYDAATGVWNVATVASGATATLTMVAKVVSSDPIVNVAEVSKSDQFDPNSTPGNGAAGEDDVASVTLTPQQSDLRLAKSVNNANPLRGDTVVYTIEVSNLGPSNATGVEITEQLPAGVDYTTFVPSSGAFDPVTGLWSLASVPANASATLVISGVFRGPAAQTNTSQITKLDQFDPTPNPVVSVTIPSQIADVSLTKGVDVANPVQGSLVVFTLRAANAGPDAATGVLVTDLLPPGLTFISATTTAGSYQPATGVWSIGRIDPSTNKTLSITARVDSFAPVGNRAAVTASDQYDPNSIPGNNDATEDDQAQVLVTPRYADLKLSKRVDTQTPTAANPNVAFTIEVFNAGPDMANAISVRDALPVGISFVSASASVGGYAAPGDWLIPALAANSRATLTLIGAVTDFTRPITNTAQITGSSLPDPTPNEQAAATVQGQSANLALTKTVSNSTPRVGAVIDYTVTVTNAGPDAATGVRVSEALPAGLALTNVVASSGVYDSALGLWSIGRVAVGTPVTLVISARVAQITAAPINNVAEISASDQFDPNSTPNNRRSGEDDQAAASITPIPVADVTVAKIPPAQLNPGRDASYQIVVKNLGPSVAAAVNLADPGPPGLTLKTSSCGTLPCALGNLQPGEDRVITIVYAVPFPYTGADPVTNVANATSSTFDPDLTNNTDRVSAAVDARADLNLVKTGPATVVPGTNAVYTLTVTNRGPSSAGNVLIEDPAQPGLTVVSVSGSGCSAVPCNVGTLVANAVATITVTAKLDAAAVVGSSVRNSATVSSTTPDPNLFDNTGTATSTVDPQTADVRISKTGPAALSAGSTVSYTITVTNDGPSDAAGVVVNDPPVAGLTQLTVSGAGCTAFPCTLGSLAANARATVTVIARVAASASVGQTFANTATVSSSATDPNATNNSATSTGTVSNLFADLSVRKVGPSSAKPGDTVSYTITVSNAGPADASSVQVSDTPQAGLTLVSVSGACAALPCTVPTVAANASAIISVTARLAATVVPGSTLRNVAAANSTVVPDPSPGDNSGETTLTVAPIADLITAITGPTQVTLGQPQRFELSVTNQGGAATTAPTTLTVTLPPGAIATLSLPSGWTFTQVGNVLTLNTSNVIAPGATVRLPMQITLVVDGPTRIDALVAGGGEAITTNNAATLALTGIAPPVPTVMGWSTGFLLLLLAMLGALRQRRARPHTSY